MADASMAGSDASMAGSASLLSVSFEVCGAPQGTGNTVRLWARDHEGWLTMDAVAEIG